MRPHISIPGPPEGPRGWDSPRGSGDVGPDWEVGDELVRDSPTRADGGVAGRESRIESEGTPVEVRPVVCEGERQGVAPGSKGVGSGQGR